MHVHSKILFHLLTMHGKQRRNGKFLKAFLEQIGVPARYLDNTHWVVSRERSFEEGRIDFVLESEEYVAAIEMKIKNSDGNLQLERYDRFCKSRCKEYGLYYLTLDGCEPGFYTFLDELKTGVETYRFYFYVEVNYELYVGFRFDKIDENGNDDWVDFVTMQKIDKDFFDKCENKVDSLEIRDLKKSGNSWWAYIENRKGERMDFKHKSDSVIELLDDMDIQVEYIGEYIVNFILKR